MKGPMSRLPLLCCLLLAAWAPPARSFCGFYVARGDAKIWNRASKVVLVRDGDRTVLTMASDFRGDPKEFAMVVPVPTFLEKGQIHVGDPATVDHLDAYSAPRLVEYFDPDPCSIRMLERAANAPSAGALQSKADDARRDRALGVRVEARYTVGEYDIVILSAQESGGLETWLVRHGYSIPAGARRVLAGYIKQNMRFFVARVNLSEQKRLGFTYLRPLQVAYESPKFMLPIRLGMVNADGPQELFVFALTRNGRVETTNYRTVKLPDDAAVPEFVKDEFDDFYRAMFAEQVEEQHGTAVFTEYAWDMSWCDPCASAPLSPEELRSLGVFWLGTPGANGAPRVMPGGGPQTVFLTRLHVRYDARHFPEDLVFQETSDRKNFQGRFVIRHPWRGDADCPAMDAYRKSVRQRREAEARSLADLTGWDLERIRKQMGVDAAWADPGEHTSWWQRLWGGDGR
ncbi:MAG: DUF2330 domain-containing protein [Hyphomicrobiales bacterium]